MEISKIGQRSTDSDFFRVRRIKSDELRSTNHKVGHADRPILITFSENHISGPRDATSSISYTHWRMTKAC